MHKISSREEEFYELSIPIPDNQSILLNAQKRGKTPKIPQRNFFLKFSDWLGFLFPFSPSFNSLSHSPSFFLPSSHRLSSQTISLIDCLDCFFTEETLTGLNRFKCDHCKCHTDSSISVSISSFPEVIAVHIKRFGFNNYSEGSKLHNPIEFPWDLLELHEYSKNLHNETEGKNKEAGLDTAPPPSSPLSNEADPPPSSSYRLISFLCHEGSLYSGHYYSYSAIFNPHGNSFNYLSQPAWFCCNDDQVYSVDPSSFHSLQPYLLFYIKLPSPSVSNFRSSILTSLVCSFPSLLLPSTMRISPLPYLPLLPLAYPFPLLLSFHLSTPFPTSVPLRSHHPFLLLLSSVPHSSPPPFVSQFLKKFVVFLREILK